MTNLNKLNKILKSLVLLTTVVSISNANYYKLEPIKITKDISCLIGDYNPPLASNNGFVSNVCYVDIGDSIVVLDAGPTYNFAKELHTLIKKEYPNKKVSNVVITNFHDDRLLGASYFKKLGINIIGHKTILEDIKEFNEKLDRMKNILTPDVLKNTKVVEANILTNNEYKIKGTKKTLTILKPSLVSEERSDIIVYSKDDSFIFAGNIVFNGRMLNYRKASNIDGWIKALEKIKSLNAKYVLGGHGNEYDKNSYKYSLQYLKILKDGVKKAYENDIDMEDVKHSFNVNKFRNIKHFDSLHNSNINNYYQQIEFE
jgi:cyclase